MNDGDLTGRLPGHATVSVDELARQQDVRPVQSFGDMRADLWDSDEEFTSFMADLRVSRQAEPDEAP